MVEVEGKERLVSPIICILSRPSSRLLFLMSTSGLVKIVVEGQEFKIACSSTTLYALRKLERMEDGSYAFPSEWNVRSIQFSTLIEFLYSTK